MNEKKILLEDSENKKAPVLEYCDETGEFEYENPELRAKARARAKKRETTDELQHRANGLKKHLRRAGLEEDMGKTGNSSTGEITETNEKVAKIQQQHAKEYILRFRRNRDISK